MSSTLPEHTDNTGPGVPDPGSRTGEQPAVASSAVRRPGWPEIGVLAVSYVILVLAGSTLVSHVFPAERPVARGLAQLALSAIAGLGAFAAAVAVRIRALEPFKIRRASGKALLAGALLGIVAFIASLICSVAYVMLTGDNQDIQGNYQAAGSGGVLALTGTLVLGSIATPIGEEFAFRGVLANALARYGAWVSVLGSAAVFALAHGINPVLPVAFVVGLISVLLMRRTGSIWPGVLVHGVNNALATTIHLVAPMLT